MKNEKKLIEMLAKFDKRIRKLYNELIDELAKAGVSINDIPEDKLFSFDDYPQVAKQVSKALSQYAKILQQDIVEGMTNAINMSFSVAQHTLYGQTVWEKKAIESVRDTATKSWLKKRVTLEEGLSLSQRVWNYTRQSKAEFEMAMSDIVANGITNGTSAEEIARRAKGLLNNPDAMYRRYHLKKTMKDGTKKDVVEWRKRTIDENGKVHFTSTDIEHPGTGVYRSARQNAFRMAATEINIAYRYADNARWQSENFVLGFHIELSDNHPIEDMCDELVGDYPKEFLWTGWHPRCRCTSTSIIMGDDEFEEYMKIPKEKRKDYVSPNRVTKMPDSYNEYIEKNQDRILRSIDRGTQPWFIKDNYVDGDITKGLKFEQKQTTAKTRKEEIAEIARKRHEQRDDKKIQELWDRHNSIDRDTQQQIELANRVARENGDATRYGMEDLIEYESNGKKGYYLKRTYMSDEQKDALERLDNLRDKMNNLLVGKSLGARGKKIDAKIQEYLDDAVNVVFNRKTTSAVRKINSMTKTARAEREDVLNAWNEREKRLKQQQAGEITSSHRVSMNIITDEAVIDAITDKKQMADLLDNLWSIDGTHWGHKATSMDYDISTLKYYYKKYVKKNYSDFISEYSKSVDAINLRLTSLDDLTADERETLIEFVKQFEALKETEHTQAKNALDGYLNFEKLKAKGADFEKVSKYMPEQLYRDDKWFVDDEEIDKRFFDKLGAYVPVDIHARSKDTDCSRKNKRVRLSKIDGRYNLEYYRKCVVYHEYGHATLNAHRAIDSQVLKDFVAKFKKQWKDKSADIDKRIREEYRRHLGSDDDSHTERYKLCNVMDIVQAISNGKYGCIDIDGHNKSYWTLENGRHELFAHICENEFMKNEYIEKLLGKEFAEEFAKLYDAVLSD